MISTSTLCVLDIRHNQAVPSIIGYPASLCPGCLDRCFKVDHSPPCPPCRTGIPLGTLRPFLTRPKMNGYLLVCLEIIGNPNVIQRCLQQEAARSYSLNMNVHCNQAELSRSLSHCLHPHLFYML